MPRTTRSADTKDTTAVHTSALAAKPATSRRAQSAQPELPKRTSRTTRATSLFPSEAHKAASPSPARETGTTSSSHSPSPPSDPEDIAGEVSDEGQLVEKEEEATAAAAADDDWEMLHTANSERSGLRGRNVEDVSQLEEEGLLRKVDGDGAVKEKNGWREVKGSGNQQRVERVLDYGLNEGDEGLNNPRDRNAFALLILLYLLQGIPLGLTFGTLPFLLKAHLSYSQLAVFSLATWPYSLKLLWSPIVDSWFVHKWGRRKSWIVPVQAIVGLGLWLIGGRIESWINADHVDINFITMIFMGLIMAAATQDIAVDGWALTLLSTPNLSYASTAQTIGLGVGNALAFTVFLAFNSSEFSNKYFRTTPLDYGLVTLGGFFRFWAVIFLVVTIGIAIYKTEDPVTSDEPDMDVKKVYKVMWSIIRLKNIQSFLLVLLTCKIGFLVNDSVTGLKLLEKGLSKEDLAVAVLLDFPAQMIAGWLVAKWSRPAPGKHPLTGTGDILKPWVMAFWARLAMAVIATGVVYFFPANGEVQGGYFALIIATTLLSSLTSTVQFIGICAFHTQIADPLIGGTYMTLLNTIANLGGTLPKPLVLRGVDVLSQGYCSVNRIPGNCASDPGKSLCEDAGGYCIVTRDGYYVMSAFCVASGAALLVWYILPTVKRLQALPMSAWRVKIPK